MHFVSVLKSALHCVTAFLTASLLGLCVLSLAYFDDLAAFAEGVLASFALIQGLAGYDAVDFWSKSIR